MNKKEPKKNSIHTLKRITGFLKPFRQLLILQILLNTVFSFLTALSITLFQPILALLFNTVKPEHTAQVSQSILQKLNRYFFDYIYSLIQSPNKFDTLLNVSYLIISVFILKNIFKYMASITSSKLEEGVVKSVRDTVFTKITGLSVDFFSRSKQGNLISIITNDVSTINATTLNSFTTSLREFTLIFLYLFTLLAISAKLTLIAFSTSIISLLLIRFAMKFLRRYASRMQIAMSEYTTTLAESISGIRVVKAYNAEETTNKRFKNDTLKYLVSAVKHKKVIEFIPFFNEIFAIAALCVVLFIGGSEVFRGQMQPDQLMLFLVALFTIMSPIANTVNSISRFQHGIIAAERVFGVLDEMPSVVTGSEKISDFNESIEIKNVSFAYADNHVLENADITISKNKKIAFVGSSGSGKSTMLDLIIRFYDPKKGEILIDGKNIRMFDVISYRALFGIVSQENMLFNDSIANNIRYGFESATNEDIIHAAKQANAYNFIMKMPQGFDTVIGDRGVTLSGGERQRVAIARSLVRNPKILVFDEATSALDAESEKIVQSAINDSMKDKTAVIVAHRLATIIDCDEILVFDNGKIVERGTHSELLQHDGIYSKLYEIQFTEKKIKNDK